MRISYWSSDVCSSDLLDARRCISYLTIEHAGPIPAEFREAIGNRIYGCDDCLAVCPWNKFADSGARDPAFDPRAELAAPELADLLARSEEHTSELQSLMRISYAVFCLKTKKKLHNEYKLP